MLNSQEIKSEYLEMLHFNMGFTLQVLDMFR